MAPPDAPVSAAAAAAAADRMIANYHVQNKSATQVKSIKKFKKI